MKIQFCTNTKTFNQFLPGVKTLIYALRWFFAHMPKIFNSINGKGFLLVCLFVATVCSLTTL